MSSLIVGSFWRSHLCIFMSFISQASIFFSSRSLTFHFSVFMDWVTDPVDSSIISNGIMHGINTNNFVIFMSSIFSYPIGVQNSQTAHRFSNTFFSNWSQRSCEFEFGNTLTGGFSIYDTLGDWSLTSSSSNLCSVDHITLFGLVS